METKEILIKVENAINAIADVQKIAMDDVTEHLCTELGGILEAQRQFIESQIGQ